MATETIKCVDYPEGKEGPKVEIEFNYDIPDDLAGCVELFTEQAILNIFKPALRLRAQKVSKTISRKGEDVQAFMSKWKPTDQLPRAGGGKRDLVGDFMKMWAGLSEEERAAMQERMNQSKAEAAAPSGGGGRSRK